jgi:hypothetical protein
MFVARQWTIGSPLPHLLVPGSGRHRGSVLGGALARCAHTPVVKHVAQHSFSGDAYDRGGLFHKAHTSS